MGQGLLSEVARAYSALSMLGHETVSSMCFLLILSAAHKGDRAAFPLEIELLSPFSD